ncbi:MAG: DUF1343 domain-containing protein, partial [Candidatus Acidoferrales bacterium]|nr:DUF1343 domain-containing protein [Candidatus Acidoferrales bacterium]
MPHNRASRAMFRYRSQAIFVVCAVAALFGASTRSGQFAGVTHTLTGVDMYDFMNSEPFAGKRVGLITNQTGMDSQGYSTIHLFAGRKDVKLVALFSPEHGFSGEADAAVADGWDAASGVPIYSLYGETRRPTDEMLKGIDVLLFDVQDAGVRFYTYITTMAYCMEAAAKHHIRFVVFDRPNPLGGEVIEGPMLDADRTSFTGYFPMPVRYGMTLGELAEMFNAENKIGADLDVFSMRNWHRSETYDQTGLPWIPPSPNLRTVEEAFLYPGIEILQAGGVSVGRGTDTPFEIVGAPWIRVDEFATELDGRKIPGVSFNAAEFTPRDGPYNGQACHGVTIRITDRASLRSILMSLEIADALHRMYPDHFAIEKIITLLGSQATVDRLKRGDA